MEAETEAPEVEPEVEPAAVGLSETEEVELEGASREGEDVSSPAVIGSSWGGVDIEASERTTLKTRT